MSWYWYVLLAVVAWLVITYMMGKPGFWKLTRQHPDLALRYFIANPDVWQVFPEKPPEGYKLHAPAAEWTGPFRISDPYTPGKLIVVYGRSDKIEAAQDEFVKIVRGHGSRQP